MDHDIPQPWTTTRCNRLLRPLLTHIAALRRELKWGISVSSLGGDGSSKSIDAPGAGSTKRCMTEPTAADKPAKRIRHTYSKRGRWRSSHDEKSSVDFQDAPVRKQKQPRPLPSVDSGDLILPTPFLRRVRNSQFSSPEQPSTASIRGNLGEDQRIRRGCNHPSKDCRRTSCAIEGALATWKLGVSDAVLRSTHDSIYRALEALFRATSPSKNRPAGSKSLVAMCLRKVPDYIAELEYWELEDAAERGTKSVLEASKASSDVYSELESLGPVEGDGWRHLGIVVRAHGLRIVAQAVADGIIHLTFSALLIKLAEQYMPQPESAALLDAHLLRTYPPPAGLEDSLLHTPAMSPLQVLKGLGSNGMDSFGLAKVNELLSRQLLPSTWLLTREFGSIWASATRLIASRRCTEQALDFIITSLSLLCDLQRTRGRQASSTHVRRDAQKTFISAIAALASISLLARGKSDDLKDDGQDIDNSTIGKRVEVIIQSCLANLGTKSIAVKNLHNYLLYLCAVISQESMHYYSAKVIETWAKLGERSADETCTRHYEATLSLLCSVVHLYSRGTGLPLNLCLTRFCEKLEGLELPGDPLKNMRVEGAFRLAEQTGDLRDLLFAERITLTREGSSRDENVRDGRIHDGNARDRNTRNRPRQTPLKPTSFFGFRWDESLSEWVTASPMFARGGDLSTPLSPILTRLRSHDLRCKGAVVPHVEREIDNEAGSDTSSASGRTDTKNRLRHQSSTAADSSATRASTSDEESGFLDEECFRPKAHDSTNAGMVVLRTQQESPGRSSGRISSEGSGITHATRVEAAKDELSLDQFDKENKVKGYRAALSQPGRKAATRRSLPNRQPLKRISNGCLPGGSSDDELGL